MPYISVVMPTYNRAGFLKEVIDSYLVQDYRNFELIVVDDKSTDNTKEVLESISDDRLKYFVNENQKGVSGARNFGVAKAVGEVIVVADSDDLSYPNRLANVAKFFTDNPDYDVYYTNLDLFNVETEELKPRFFQPYNYELLKIVNYIPNPSSSFKKLSFQEMTNGYDYEQKIGEDYDLWLTLAENGAKFGFSPTSQVKMRIHPGSIRVEKQAEHRGFIKQLRAKHGLPEIPSVEALKELAEPEVYEFFTQPHKLDLWFK